MRERERERPSVCQGVSLSLTPVDVSPQVLCDRDTSVPGHGDGRIQHAVMVGGRDRERPPVNVHGVVWDADFEGTDEHGVS
jgi:hypothetical protein